jgi:hypothetical protein
LSGGRANVVRSDQNIKAAAFGRGQKIAVRKRAPAQLISKFNGMTDQKLSQRSWPVNAKQHWGQAASTHSRK